MLLALPAGVTAPLAPHLPDNDPRPSSVWLLLLHSLFLLLLLLLRLIL